MNLKTKTHARLVTNLETFYCVPDLAAGKAIHEIMNRVMDSLMNKAADAGTLRSIKIEIQTKPFVREALADVGEVTLESIMLRTEANKSLPPPISFFPQWTTMNLVEARQSESFKHAEDLVKRGAIPSAINLTVEQSMYLFALRKTIV